MPFLQERDIRVLVLEDNPADRDLVMDFLEMDDTRFSSDFAPTLSKALSKLHQEHFDVAIVDLGLPDSQGIDTISTILQNFQSLPVITLTGHDDDEIARNAIRKGAQDYLVKGRISPDQLKRAIRYAIARKDTENELMAIYDNAPVLMMLLDQDRRILRLNQLISEYGKGGNGKLIGLRGGDALQCLHAKSNDQGCGNAPFCKQCKIRESVLSTLETGDPVKNLETVLPIAFEDQVEDLFLSVSTTRIILNNQPKVLVALADVTQRVKAIENLHRSEALLNATQKLTKIGGWEWDVVKKEGFWTDEVYNIHGIDKNELGSGPEAHLEKSLECYLPEYRNIILSAFNRCIEKGRPYDFEMPFVKATGKKIWIRTTGHPIYKDNKVVRVIGNIMDITDRKEVEEGLKKSEAFLDATGKMAKVGGWELDTKTLDVRWTDVTYDIHEVPKAYRPTFEEALNFFHEDDRDKLREAMDKAIRIGTPYDMEMRFITAKGNELWTHTKCSPVEQNGRIVRLIGTFQDITETKKAQEEKKILQEQFQQAQKLESVGRLAGGVAHDLNNMLVPILGFAEILMDDFGPDDDRRESVQEIVNAGIKAKELVAQLLAFSRKQVLEFAPLGLNNIITGFEKLLRRTIRENVAIHLDMAPSLPPIQGDIGQLEQVIMNLAVNAQDAMQDGGTLSIKTSLCEKAEGLAPENASGHTGPFVALTVSDTGVGMSEDVKSHIFEPFFTTKSKDKGTGLGLATVYGIVKQHHGYVNISSEEGKGTQITIYLPPRDSVPIGTIQKPMEPDEGGGSETILLVEDNAQVRSLAKLILKRRGYKVLEAENGAQATEVMKSSDQLIDLLLTDVVMPDISGKELFLQLSENSKIKVIYMSGYDDEIIANQGILEDGVDFVQKPFSGRVLAAKVRQVLDRT